MLVTRIKYDRTVVFLIEVKIAEEEDFRAQMILGIGFYCLNSK